VSVLARGVLTLPPTARQAAGCGDKAMVLKLVQLGTDINCRDSVGGTPMHHAAMAGAPHASPALAPPLERRAPGLRAARLSLYGRAAGSVRPGRAQQGLPGGQASQAAAPRGRPARDAGARPGAGKKETMFALARLGCDWRARAEGIDGATAAFVLCGQHGKSGNQQKLVEAKLRKVAAEGAEERARARQLAADPAAAPSAAAGTARDGGGGAGGVGGGVAQAASAARADANMAALLEEVEQEGEGGRGAAAAARRRKKKKRERRPPDGAERGDEAEPGADAEAAPGAPEPEAPPAPHARAGAEERERAADAGRPALAPAAALVTAVRGGSAGPADGACESGDAAAPGSAATAGGAASAAAAPTAELTRGGSHASGSGRANGGGRPRAALVHALRASEAQPLYVCVKCFAAQDAPVPYPGACQPRAVTRAAQLRRVTWACKAGCR